MAWVSFRYNRLPLFSICLAATNEVFKRWFLFTELRLREYAQPIVKAKRRIFTWIPRQSFKRRKRFTWMPAWMPDFTLYRDFPLQPTSTLYIEFQSWRKQRITTRWIPKVNKCSSLSSVVRSLHGLPSSSSRLSLPKQVARPHPTTIRISRSKVTSWILENAEVNKWDFRSNYGDWLGNRSFDFKQQHRSSSTYIYI